MADHGTDTTLSSGSGAGKQSPRPQTEKALLDWWKAEIRSAVRYRTVYGLSKKWSYYKNMYRGFWPKGIVPVNIIYAVGRSVIPQIYFRNPRVALASKKPGFTPHAMVVERLDNYLIKEIGIKDQLKSNALDCYLMGRGPGILGYDSEFGFNPKFAVDSKLKDSGLSGFNTEGEMIEYVDEVKPGMPWYLRCNPEDFVVPWGTHRFEEARWFAFRKMRTAKDIQESPLYENHKNLKGNFHTKLDKTVDSDRSGSPATTSLHSEKDDTNEWVELWEIHDKKTGKVLAISLDHDQFLRDDEDFLQIEGLNARVLGFNEDPDFFWWTPDARLIEVQQAEINDIRTMARRHRRVGLLKGLYDKNAIKPEEMAKFLDEDVKSFAGVDVGVQGDIRKTVAFVQSHIPPDLIPYAREVREDVREIVGFSRNQMGSFEQGSGRRTAHEAEIVRAASAIRIDERRDIMADHLESVIRGINQIIFKNWTAQRVVDIIGQDGARYWVRFTGPEIKAEMHYTINPEESLPEDQRTRREDTRQFLELAQNVPGADMSYILQQHARQFEWLDPKRLFPQNEGAGRSPEKALLFQDFAGRVGRQTGALGG